MTSVGQQQQQQHGSSRSETGFYCSTSGTYFSDKESLAEHYKSDFHRYNLKRKVAGLPPVTKEWFEARKAQLSTAAAAPHTKIWYDPLTKKKFQTQQTYQAHVNSKKYQQLVRDSGEPAPAPIIMVKQLREEEPEAAAAGTAAAAQPPAGPKPAQPAGFALKYSPARPSAAYGTKQEGDEEEEEPSSGWETASEEEEEARERASDGEWADWDPCTSFFDNKVSSSTEENLQYMYKRFGFFLPDAEYLADPEGLLKYLGAKLTMGKVPLYTAGDDPNAKQFRSLHAVQRHMVDTNQCRMLFDGNEEEYEDFYDYSQTNNTPADAAADDATPSTSTAAAADAAPADSAGKQLSLAFDGLSLGSSGAAGGWELAVPSGSSGSGSKVLGSRDFARYYRQRPKPQDNRRSVFVNTIIAQYRSMGLATQTSTPPVVERAAQRQQQKMQKRTGQLLYSRNNVNFNLPNNVPY